MLDPEKLLIKLKCAFIPSRRQRNEIRQKAVEALNRKKLVSSIWGVSYSVFDGEELLESSLKSIRSEAGYINVIYQLTSWHGNPADPNLLPLLMELRDQKLIDELVEFKPDLSKRPGTNERAKRNLGLKHARRFGCDYFMTMDCDEFYLAEEVKKAKEDIIRWGLTHSYCPQIIYGFDPTQRILDATFNFVPFFCRLTPWSRLVRRTDQPCKADKTRCLSTGFFPFERVLDSVSMHHMKYLRKDLHKKIDNSSFAGGRVKVPIPHESDLKVCTVENQFDINIWSK